MSFICICTEVWGNAKQQDAKEETVNCGEAESHQCVCSESFLTTMVSEVSILLSDQLEPRELLPPKIAMFTSIKN